MDVAGVAVADGDSQVGRRAHGRLPELEARPATESDVAWLQYGPRA
jgi:hypothetical protein